MYHSSIFIQIFKIFIMYMEIKSKKKILLFYLLLTKRTPDVQITDETHEPTRTGNRFLNF